MPYHCLPEVNSCCILIKSLRKATILIALITLVRGYRFTSFYADYDSCNNLFQEYLVAPISFLLIVCSLLVMTVSFALFVFLFTKVQWPVLLDVYITAVFTMIILAVFHAVISTLHLLASGFTCKRNGEDDYTKESLATILLFDSLTSAVYMTYFVTVVNSYGIQLEST